MACTGVGGGQKCYSHTSLPFEFEFRLHPLFQAVAHFDMQDKAEMFPAYCTAIVTAGPGWPPTDSTTGRAVPCTPEGTAALI